MYMYLHGSLCDWYNTYIRLQAEKLESKSHTRLDAGGVATANTITNDGVGEVDGEKEGSGSGRSPGTAATRSTDYEATRRLK